MALSGGGHESQTCGRSHNSIQHIMASKTDHKHSISGHAGKAREMQEVIIGSALWDWSSCDSLSVGSAPADRYCVTYNHHLLGEEVL